MVTFWQAFILLVGVGLFLFGLFGIALQDRWGLHPVYLYFWIMSGPVAVAFAFVKLHEIRKDFRKGKEEMKMDCVTGSGFYFDKNDNLIFKMEKETVVYGLGLSNPNAPFLITDYEKLKNFILPLLNDSIAENEGKVSFGVVLDTIFENACEVDESESGVRSFDLSCNDEYEEWQKELRQYKEGS